MISVIIPSYNHEKYIDRCIESVLNQTFHDFELIIIDDASEDKSWEIIKSFTDKRIRSLKLSSNHGADYVQNKGIELARYDYVGILNSDDCFSENRLAKCLNLIKDRDVDIIGTDIELINSEGKVIKNNWWTDSFDLQKKIFEEHYDWCRSLFAGNMFMTTSNFFFRKSIFFEIGGFSNYKYVLDYDFLLRSFFAGFKFQWLDEPLLKYRLHDKNTITRKPLKANQEASQLIRKFLTYLPCNDESLRASIKEGVNQLQKFEKYIEQVLHSDFQKLLDASNLNIAKRDKWIADRDKWIADRDEWIADRDEWIDQRDETIQALTNELEKIKSTFIYKVKQAVSLSFRTFLKSNK